MAIAPDLFEILRCPYCVSGDTRKPGDDPGLLELVHDGAWLICQESDCDRKYPIKEDISVMAHDVKKSGDNLFKLLENLLVWARIQMDRVDFRPEKIHGPG